MPRNLHGKALVLLPLEGIQPAERDHLEKIVRQNAFHWDADAVKAIDGGLPLGTKTDQAARKLGGKEAVQQL